MDKLFFAVAGLVAGKIAYDIFIQPEKKRVMQLWEFKNGAFGFVGDATILVGRFLDEGAMRKVFECSLNGDTGFVCKQYKMGDQSMLKRDIVMQFFAKGFSDRFNATRVPKKVTFLVAYLLVDPERHKCFYWKENWLESMLSTTTTLGLCKEEETLRRHFPTSLMRIQEEK